MSFLTSWVSRFINHFRSNDVSAEIDREMSFHLAERTDALVAAGLSHKAAESEARRRFGNVGLQKERTRDRDLFAWLDTLLGDLRYAARSLRAAPAFSLVAILSLGLGIGANTAIFSILNAVMLKSLPVSHPEELVALMRDKDDDVYTNPLWEAIRDRQDVFSGVFAFGFTDLNLTDGGEAHRIGGSFVSGDFFSTLDVQTILGRPITRADDYRGCPGVAVLSHGFWQSEYGGHADAIGKTVRLDGKPFQILGVTDQRFFGVNVGERPQVYIPLCSEALLRGTGSSLDRRSSWFLQVIGRPKPGITPQQIAARFSILAPGIVESTMPTDWPQRAVDQYRKTVFSTVPADKGFSDLRSTYKRALYILMAIVSLVLLVACANVANLLLARAAVRRREMAVRLALGAGRARIARQLITESLLLSSIGAALGIAVATWGSRALLALLSRTGRTVSLDLSIDMSVLLFTIAVATLTGLLFGMAPAWRSGRVDPQAAMKAQGRGVAEGQTRFTMGKALVVAQVALSLVLVVGAGLLLGSWRKLATLDPGFTRDHILLVNTDIRPGGLPPEQRFATLGRILERVRGLPGVRVASASQLTPVGRSSWNDVIKAEGFEAKSERDAISWANAVTDKYFTTMGIPLLSGRDFDARDTKSSARVAIISETMARKFFKTPAAVGRRFQKQEGKEYGPPIEVVGVVGDTKYRSLRDSAQPIMYFPRSQEAEQSQRMDLELRTDGSPAALIPAVKAAIAEINPRFTLDFMPLAQQLAESMTLMRTIATVSGFFGALALLLSTIGLYGLMSYNVARRRNEIGVRIALGAAQSRVVRMVLGETSRIVVLGVVLGVALSYTATRLVTTFLYGLQPHDPRTIAGSALLLVAIGLTAAALPAVRASRLDPVEALRED